MTTRASKGRLSLDSNSGFAMAAAAIVLVALLLRILYSTRATVEAPISGDATQYMAYAWNMLHSGTFSKVIPGSGGMVVPDGYRGPGYPLLLYVALWIGETSGSWYAFVLKIQAALGAATVLVSMLLGRRFLPAPLALLSGLVLALWPHLITINGYLLSETLFGFLLVLSLWTSCLVFEDPSKKRCLLAGLASGLACLVNPIYLLFPWLIAALIGIGKNWKPALLFLAVAMALPTAWSVRNAGLAEQPEASSRIVQNFVQGSWPLFQAAYMSRDVDPVPRQILAAVSREEQLMAQAPLAGLQGMWDRFSVRPLDYLGWYVLDKPYLLWDWDIRIGQGDIYIIHTENSPFETNPIWHAAKLALHWLNPVFFFASLLFALGVVVLGFRKQGDVNRTALMLALFYLYVTGLHVVLQAEPRYSIPYRPVEILLAFGLVAAMFRSRFEQPSDQTHRAGILRHPRIGG
jgi:4-amino-4-deoxy-L-arabinose transferase-like glycosyltransferase